MKVKGLKTGAKIGIFSPSEPITEERIVRFEKGVGILKSKGFGTQISLNAMNSLYYSAGTVNDRANDISQLIMDDSVSALMASWGGKSCNQLINAINYSEIAEKRKPILAFSDGCVLLNAITAKTGLFTFHGPNVAGKMFETKHSNLALIRSDVENKNSNLLGDVSSTESKVIKKGVSQGKLFGGNLSTFTLGLGGNNLLKEFKGGIFFWESLGEPIQIVHQYLQCLRNMGLFDTLSGMVIGDYITNDEFIYRRRPPEEMLLEVTKGYNFPVLYARTFGHPGELENPIIPIGPVSELNTMTKSLSLMEEVIF